MESSQAANSDNNEFIMHSDEPMDIAAQVHSASESHKSDEISRDKG